MLYYKTITEHFLQQNAGLATRWAIWDVMPSVAQWSLGLRAQFPNLTMLDFTLSFSCCGCTYRGAGPSYSHFLHFCHIL